MATGWWPDTNNLVLFPVAMGCVLCNACSSYACRLHLVQRSQFDRWWSLILKRPGTQFSHPLLRVPLFQDLAFAPGLPHWWHATMGGAELCVRTHVAYSFKSVDQLAIVLRDAVLLVCRDGYQACLAGSRTVQQCCISRSENRVGTQRSLECFSRIGMVSPCFRIILACSFFIRLSKSLWPQMRAVHFGGTSN